MNPTRFLVLSSACAILASVPSCDPGRPPAPASADGPRGGVSEVKPGDEVRAVAGQTIYVPAYSSVHISEGKKPFDLAVTLSVRNADPGRAIVVSSVRYHGSDGRLIRSHLERPLRLAPLAAFEVFIKESDTSGGPSPSFLVAWVADAPAAPPVVESVMIGTMGTQGISFVCPGRVIPVPAPDPR